MSINSISAVSANNPSRETSFPNRNLQIQEIAKAALAGLAAAFASIYYMPPLLATGALIIIVTLSIRAIAKIFSRVTETFEERIADWVNNPSVIGQKQEASEKIINAYNNKKRALNLSSLRLSSLPPEIGQLTALTELNLYNNQLRSLPLEIGQLTALTVLNLDNNQLSSLPTQIGQLTALTRLNLDHNKLSSLPTEIGQLTALTELYLGDNQLLSLPTEIGQLTVLTELYLGNNQLSSLPTQIGQLTALTRLYLSHNPLSSLPTQIGQLTALTELYLGSNQLSSLPTQIGQLTALTRLDLSYNQLLSLPTEIGQLTALTWLNLRNNPLSSLPLSLGNIPSLTFFSIEETSVPEEEREAILATCRASRDREALIKLPSQLDHWKEVAKLPDIDLGFLLNLNEEARRDISEWLLRLSRTADFARVQKNLANNAMLMLQSVCASQEFRETFLAQVNANNVACGDRAAMAFNEIFVCWNIHTLDDKAPLQQKLALLAGCAKTLALRNALEKTLEGKDERESVEIFLYYETLFRETLGLVTAIKQMRYEGIGKRNWINEQDLIKAVKDNYLTAMTGIPTVKTLAEKDPIFQDQMIPVSSEFASKMEWLENEGANEGDYITQSRALFVEREEAEKALIIKWINSSL